MRDLKADLEICRKATPVPWKVNTDYKFIDIINPKNPDFRIATVATMHDAAFIAAAREGWPEAIDRAIAAEANYKHLGNVVVAALTEENDIQRASIQQLSRQVVGLREALKRISEYCEPGPKLVKHIAEKALSFPDPGKQYREKMAKMQKVVDNARFLLEVNQNGCMSQVGESELAKALAELEGVKP